MAVTKEQVEDEVETTRRFVQQYKDLSYAPVSMQVIVALAGERDALLRERADYRRDESKTFVTEMIGYRIKWEVAERERGELVIELEAVLDAFADMRQCERAKFREPTNDGGVLVRTESGGLDGAMSEKLGRGMKLGRALLARLKGGG